MKRNLKKLIKWLVITVTSLVLLITLLLYQFKDQFVGMAVNQVNKYLSTKVSVSEVDLTDYTRHITPNINRQAQ